MGGSLAFSMVGKLAVSSPFNFCWFSEPHTRHGIFPQNRPPDSRWLEGMPPVPSRATLASPQQDLARSPTVTIDSFAGKRVLKECGWAAITNLIGNPFGP